jgi:hypothetical protein
LLACCLITHPTVGIEEGSRHIKKHSQELLQLDLVRWISAEIVVLRFILLCTETEIEWRMRWNEDWVSRGQIADWLLRRGRARGKGEGRGAREEKGEGR